GADHWPHRDPAVLRLHWHPDPDRCGNLVSLPHHQGPHPRDRSAAVFLTAAFLQTDCNSCIVASADSIQLHEYPAGPNQGGASQEKTILQLALLSASWTRGSRSHQARERSQRKLGPRPPPWPPPIRHTKLPALALR